MIDDLADILNDIEERVCAIERRNNMLDERTSRARRLLLKISKEKQE